MKSPSQIPFSKRATSQRAAFTLIELLVVIAIIAVLAAIIMPVFSKIKEAGHKAECAANLRQLGNAALLVAAEHNGQLPGKGKNNPPNLRDPRWQDIINAHLESKITYETSYNTEESIVQRFGDSPRKGALYCPSVKLRGADTFSRAYTANFHIVEPDIVDTPGSQPQTHPNILSGRDKKRFAKII